MGIRAKGNNSRRLTEKCGHDRYSLKVSLISLRRRQLIRFDKFSLDASFQFNSYENMDRL